MNCDRRRWGRIGFSPGIDLSQFPRQSLQRPETIVLRGQHEIAIPMLSREPSRGGGMEDEVYGTHLNCE